MKKYMILEQFFTERNSSPSTQTTYTRSIRYYETLTGHTIQECLDIADDEEYNNIRWKNTQTRKWILSYREWLYSKYNVSTAQLYLKEHEEPSVNIEVDVANLIGHEYNNYQLHDKIYLKLDNTKELITARVTKTEKEAHDVAKNTIEISNYKNINTIKTIQHETYIDAQNTSFKYHCIP